MRKLIQGVYVQNVPLDISILLLLVDVRLLVSFVNLGVPSLEPVHLVIRDITFQVVFVSEAQDRT